MMQSATKYSAYASLVGPPLKYTQADMRPMSRADATVLTIRRSNLLPAIHTATEIAAPGMIVVISPGRIASL
jgi:hypothetical protein